MSITIGDTIKLRNFRWNCPGCNQLYQLYPTNEIGDVLTCDICKTVAHINVFTKHNSQLTFHIVNQLAKSQLQDYTPKKPNIAEMMARRKIKEKEFNMKKWLEQ